MSAFTATAYLRQPATCKHPPMLDALLYVGLHRRLSGLDPVRWPGPAPLPEIFQLDLPLAKVESPHGWWWAASQATPRGPEAVRHEHRRPPIEGYARHQRPDRRGRVAKVSRKVGPDKALRVPVHTRSGWWTPTWTGVIDAERASDVGCLLEIDGSPLDIVQALLRLVPSIGARTNGGHGAISYWEVVPGGPALASYSADLSVRHLPVSSAAFDALATVGHVVRRQIPLRPPYYSRDVVDCLQSPHG